MAEFVKRVDKKCSDNAIYNEVEKVDAGGTAPCFTQCSDSGVGPHRNASSPCWIACFYNTVLGPAAGQSGGAVTGMPLQDLVTVRDYSPSLSSSSSPFHTVSSLKQSFLATHTHTYSTHVYMHARSRPTPQSIFLRWMVADIAVHLIVTLTYESSL